MQCDGMECTAKKFNVILMVRNAISYNNKVLETRSNPVNYNIQLIVLVYNTTQYIAMQCIQ